MTHCGGAVAFSMMQTSERLEPLSMWYSSSARMKASGVTTFRSARRDLIPAAVFTCDNEWKDGRDEKEIRFIRDSRL